MRRQRCGRLRRVGRLAVDGPAELEHRVAAEHERSLRPRPVQADALHHGLGLEPGQGEGERGRAGGLHGGLVDAADDDLWVEARGAQRLQSGRTGRGEHERSSGSHG